MNANVAFDGLDARGLVVARLKPRDERRPELLDAVAFDRRSRLVDEGTQSLLGLLLRYAIPRAAGANAA
jgi:hypothetical protein